MEGDFRSSLVNEAFRDTLMERVQSTKELIVAKALFGIDAESAPNMGSHDGADPLADLDGELDDYEADPLGIAIPWEEKYGAERNEDDSNDGQETPTIQKGNAS